MIVSFYDICIFFLLLPTRSVLYLRVEIFFVSTSCFDYNKVLLLLSMFLLLLFAYCLVTQISRPACNWNFTCPACNWNFTCPACNWNFTCPACNWNFTCPACNWNFTCPACNSNLHARHVIQILHARHVIGILHARHVIRILLMPHEISGSRACTQILHALDMIFFNMENNEDFFYAHSFQMFRG